MLFVKKDTVSDLPQTHQNQQKQSVDRATKLINKLIYHLYYYIKQQIEQCDYWV